MSTHRTNAFTSLSLLAAREHWCWQLHCTTCGHMQFRWGLQALANGLHPDDPSWPVHSNQTSTQLATICGPLPPLGNWPRSQQQALQSAAAGCLLEHIASRVPFPDWLGHLGLLLFYTENVEQSSLILTHRFVPQMLMLIEAGTPAEPMLREHVLQNQPLRWKELELVEHSFQRRSKSR